MSLKAYRVVLATVASLVAAESHATAQKILAEGIKDLAAQIASTAAAMKR